MSEEQSYDLDAISHPHEIEHHVSELVNAAITHLQHEEQDESTIDMVAVSIRMIGGLFVNIGKIAAYADLQLSRSQQI